MWNSSTSMSGSPFCRQAATTASSFTEGHVFAVLDTGTGGLQKNAGASVFIARLRASRTRIR